MNKKLLFNIILILLTLIVFLVAGEIGTRLLVTFEEPPEKLPPFNTAVKDSKLGWKCKANYSWSGEMKDAGGVPYDVDLNFVEEGFRYYEKEKKPDRPTLLLIGDSYTQAVEVSDDKTFFQIWRDSLALNLYAYGMAGYGTYQELMILEEYLDKINPDMVMLQYCSNDFIDNYWEVEKQSSYQVGLKRPYLKENQRVVYRVPLTFWKRLWNVSKFYRFLVQTLGNPVDRNEKTAEHKIGELGKDYPEYKTSIAITRNILKRVKEVVGPEREFYLMAADGFFPQLDHIREICKELDIWLMESAVHRMNEAKDRGEIYHSADNYHWNEYGHMLVGNGVLVDLRLAMKY